MTTMNLSILFIEKRCITLIPNWRFSARIIVLKSLLKSANNTLQTQSRALSMQKTSSNDHLPKIKQKVYMGLLNSYISSAGQRTRVPPDPIPNSEVKPCSVSSCSVVLGHVNLGKLATPFSLIQFCG